MSAQPDDYDVLPGMVRLRVGDVVLLDGGEHTITMANDCRAVATPTERKRVRVENKLTGEAAEFDRRAQPKNISATLEKRLLLRRGGQEAAAAAKAGAKPGMVRLQPGDRLCYMGLPCTVVAVAEKTATVGALDGREWTEKRLVNETFLRSCDAPHTDLRTDDAGRAKNLAAFLAARTPPAARAEQTAEENNQQKEQEVMARKPKAKEKPKAEKDGAARKGADDAVVLAFIKEQRKANDKATLGGLIKAFRASGQSCSQQRMAALFAKG